MREILFRGKRVDNGQWVNGFYAHELQGGHFISADEGAWYDGPMLSYVEVIPETVGQDTELKDTNGQRIFEGDVVECISTWDKANMVVIFEDGEYRLVLCDKYKNYTPGSGYYSIGCFDKKVIANIHDNPEAMGETK